MCIRDSIDTAHSSTIHLSDSLSAMQKRKLPLKQLKSKVKEGFRIQIFESMVSSIARAEAKRFQNILGDTVYIEFEAPLYKLRIGNYADRKKAERAVAAIARLGAKDSWIVRTKIDMEK